MKFIKQIGRTVFQVVPPYSHAMYQFCARYVDRFNGDNNVNPKTNGEYSFLRKELGKLNGGIVFDVGANVGDWASFTIDANPKVNLHCFEPSKVTFDRLAQKQWPSNVQINNFGLGESEGQLTLNVVAEESGMNSVYLRRGIEGVSSVKSEKVAISTIDTYCQKKGIQRIDLLKVDVEGHELAVFKGMSQMLAKGRIQIIQFEYGGCNLDAKVSLSDIWDFLEPHGYKFYKLYPEGPRHIEKYRQNLEIFKYSNWVAKRQ